MAGPWPTNVFARPHDAALDSRWPQHLRRSVLDPYYDLAAHMLEMSPTPADPRTGRVPARTTLVEDLMRDRQAGTVRPNLAVTFGDPDTWRPNRHGVPRRGCAFVGECVLGCNQGAKNSLDATYLAVAQSHGARSVTGAEVVRIEPSVGDYRVTTRSPTDPGEPPRTWHTRRVFLAAGAVATTELLLRARDLDRTLPRLSGRLGHGFSGNGDFLTLAESRGPGEDLTTGPTITTTTILDVPEGRGMVWFQVQDGAFPIPLHALLESALPGAPLRTLWNRFVAPSDARRAFTVLAMGHDSGGGTLRLDRSGDIVLSWRNRWQTRLVRSQRRVGPMLTRQLGARTYNPPTWSLLRRTTTVHPLGGVPAGADALAGVVDDVGEVHGHPNLFVIDGSTLPASTGVNPSATILAAAERSIETIIRREGRPRWRAPEWPDVSPGQVSEDAASTFAADLAIHTRGGGITFEEELTSATTDQLPVRLRLTVETSSIAGLFADPQHSLSVRGTLDVGHGPGDEPDVRPLVIAAPVTGTLSLFPEDDGAAMRYEVEFRDQDGRSGCLTGTKTITGVTPWTVLRDLSRLDTTLRIGGDQARIIHPELRIGPAALAALLTGIRGAGFTRARRVLTIARFVAFFADSTIRRSAQTPGRTRRRHEATSRAGAAA